MGCNISTPLAPGPGGQRRQDDGSKTACRAAPVRSDTRCKEVLSSGALEVRAAPATGPGSLTCLPRSVAARGSWLSLAPALLTVDDFLSSSECDQLMSLGLPDLRRSRVTDGHVSSGRTSYSCFLTNEKATDPLVITIEKRILEFVNLCQASLDDIEGVGESPRLVSAEPLQVVRYTQGQGYTSHFDNRAGSQARKATFMVYLNDVEAGGQTFFPRARVWAPDAASGEETMCTGVKISPRKGRCIFFLNIRHSKEDECSLHEAMPVATGDKWITTLWLGHDESQLPSAAPGC